MSNVGSRVPAYVTVQNDTFCVWYPREATPLSTRLFGGAKHTVAVTY